MGRARRSERSREQYAVGEAPEAEGESGGPRSLWSGTITFGLVSIPVDLFPGNRSGGARLRTLDERGRPLRRRYFCPRHDDAPLEAEEIVRGKELEKNSGEFVVLTDEELEALAPEKSRDIDLKQFVDRAEIDPLLFQRSYFLVPASESTKAYRLLAAIMERTGRAGIATFVMRGHQYLVAIVADGGLLRAETLRYHDEVRAVDTLEIEPNAKPDKAMVAAMVAAIEEGTTEGLDPDEMVDTATQELDALVERKRKAGEGVVAAKAGGPKPTEGTIVDLMAVLKARLSGESDPESEPPRARATSGASTTKKKSKPKAAEDLEKASKQELYERAKKLGVEGRSKMSRDELIDAIRQSA